MLGILIRNQDRVYNSLKRKSKRQANKRAKYHKGIDDANLCLQNGAWLKRGKPYILSSNIGVGLDETMTPCCCSNQNGDM